MCSSDLPEAAVADFNSLRGETLADRNFFSRVYVHGRRLRSGVNLQWASGPYSIKSEWLRAAEQRLGVGIQQQDLPDLLSHGAYLSATWLLTGEKKTDAVRPKREFLKEGFGAVEIALRYERLRFESSYNNAIASRSARATAVMPNSDNAVTFGLNWYLNRFARIQVNSLRETLLDSGRAPISGTRVYWTAVARLQFQM